MWQLISGRERILRLEGLPRAGSSNQNSDNLPDGATGFTPSSRPAPLAESEREESDDEAGRQPENKMKTALNRFLRRNK